MKYRILSLVLIAFMATGFSWGRKEEDSSSKKKTSTSASTTYASSAAANRSVAASKAGATPAVNAPGEGEFPSELIGALAKGSEEERQARIASLKRLSVALSDMKKKSAEGEATVASTETVQKSSWRTSY